MTNQTMPVFCVNETKFKPQATVQKSEIKSLSGWSYLQHLRFQIYGRHLSYPIYFIYYFVIHKKMHILLYTKTFPLHAKNLLVSHR